MKLDCRLLDSLFMTTVKLEAPLSGASLEEHMAQMAEDAGTLTAEHNLRILERLQVSR